MTYPWVGLPCFPLVVKEFISDSECEDLLAFLSNNESKFGELVEGNFWLGRTMTIQQSGSPVIQEKFTQMRTRMAKHLRSKLEEHLGSQPPLYSDLINFARWPVGYELHPHADAENPGGSPHPYPWRHFAAVVYLNEDYEGGKIHFPNLGIELQPEARSLIMFPGTLHYLHGVRPVTRGMRHTIASFLTFDETKHDRFGGAM
jgi:hypothetical protein